MIDERFFVYSMENQKPIRVMIEDESGALRYLNIRVIQWDEDNLFYLPNSRKAQKAKSISRTRILSASYARGDTGESDCLKGYNE